MLTFNDLLALEGVDKANVRLVRHRDSRLGAARLYAASVIEIAQQYEPRFPGFRVFVCRVDDEYTPDDTIEQIESYWKNKLLSRPFGLNRNRPARQEVPEA